MSDDLVRNDDSNPLADLPEVRDWAWAVTQSRPPDFTIGRQDKPPILRWFAVPRNRVNNTYVHLFVGDDIDEALHDHPWDNRSWILDGQYWEHVADGSVILRETGDIIERRAEEPHRVELFESHRVLTLFNTGPVRRSWGFHCPRGWRHWREFVEIREAASGRGKGCE